MERDFSSSMQFGIERYLQPLRYSVVAPSEHDTLFQNLEKLVAMADFNVQLLRQNAEAVEEQGSGAGELYVDSVGGLYQRHVSKISM